MLVFTKPPAVPFPSATPPGPRLSGLEEASRVLLLLCLWLVGIALLPCSVETSLTWAFEDRL